MTGFSKERRRVTRMRNYCKNRLEGIDGVLDVYIGAIPNDPSDILFIVVTGPEVEKVVTQRLKRIRSIKILVVREDLVAKARRVKDANDNWFFSVAGVVGHGIGLTDDGKVCIRIYTETPEAIEKAQKIFGESIEGVSLWYVVIGKPVAY